MVYTFALKKIVIAKNCHSFVAQAISSFPLLKNIVNIGNAILWGEKEV